MPKLAGIVSALSKLLDRTHQKEPGPFNHERLKEFEVLKDALISLPDQSFPILKRQFTLDTDECDCQVGCILFRKTVMTYQLHIRHAL